MPKLHTVVLNFITSFNKLNIYLPWAQLTCLIMGGVEEFLWRILLTQCPALETGFFIFFHRYELLPIDITLEHLKSLAIDFHHPSDPSIFDGIPS